MLWGVAPAAAQAPNAQYLDAEYSVKLVGLPVGKGNLHVGIHGDQFAAKVDGATAKLLRLFTGGEGSGSSQGNVVHGDLMTSDYRSSLSSSKKTEEIHVTLANGDVQQVGIVPPSPVDPNRKPVSDAQRHGVRDPITAAAIRVPGTGDVVTPEACHTTSQVFDGRMRYDLKFEFKRIEEVKIHKGYHGRVVVCAIYFVPIAGYIPDRPIIKYLSARRDIEIALAPIARTRILVPFWMKGPTPLGQAVLEATSFNTQ